MRFQKLRICVAFLQSFHLAYGAAHRESGVSNDRLGKLCKFSWKTAYDLGTKIFTALISIQPEYADHLPFCLPTSAELNGFVLTELHFHAVHDFHSRYHSWTFRVYMISEIKSWKGRFWQVSPELVVNLQGSVSKVVENSAVQSSLPLLSFK